MTKSADLISVEYGTAVNVQVVDRSDSHQAYLFVRIEQIENPVILLHDAGVSLVT